MKAKGKKNKMPSLTGKQIISALEKNGGYVEKYEGSHARVIFNGNLVIVPVHGNKDIPNGTLQSIIRQTKLTKKQFKNLFSCGIIMSLVSKITNFFGIL